jgi:UDP-glucose 4-epimerase
MFKRGIQNCQKRVKAMSILLTGANGYIGSQLTWFLKSIGEEVVTLDLEDYNLNEISNKLFKGDIRDPELLKRIFQVLDVEIVVHLAALKSVPESILFPEKYMSVNQAGTIQLAEMSRLMKVKLFINMGTQELALYLNLPKQHQTPHMVYRSYKLRKGSPC